MRRGGKVFMLSPPVPEECLRDITPRPSRDTVNRVREALHLTGGDGWVTLLLACKGFWNDPNIPLENRAVAAARVSQLQVPLRVSQ